MLRSSHARYLARLVAAGLTSAAALVIAELAIIATRTPRLPPAPGPREGRSGETGKLPALRLLVFGDSVACGVGCPSNEDALAGGLARRIAATTARAVDWTVLGLSGATAASMDAALVPRIAAPYDVVVISVGVNHVISLHSPARYERELAALLRRLRARCGSAARIVVCDCPPMHAFPQVSYLWPARALFRRAAAAMTAAARRACARAGDGTASAAVDLSRYALDDPAWVASMMAPDGFHPARGACELLAPHICAAAGLDSPDGSAGDSGGL